MTNLFDNVTGNLLHIEELHSSIPFTSASDALFTSLFLKYEDIIRETSVFNDLLLLFHHPDFRSEKVTMKKAEDMLTTIADRRQAVMRARNSRQILIRTNFNTQLVPYPQTWRLISDLVAEYLDSTRAPFHDTILPKSHKDDRPLGCDVNRLLAKMSLVHRTWSQGAQHFLRRRLHAVGDYRTILQSPLIGPWVRELSVFGDHNPTSAHLRLLRKILERCPNITHLHMSRFPLVPMYRKAREIKRPCDVVARGIINLHRLEHLWLGRSCSQVPEENLRVISTMLPNLPLLKSLALDEWSLPFADRKGSSSPILTLNHSGAATPPSTLTSLSLISVINATQDLLPWLTNSRGGNRVATLELIFDDIVDRNLEQLEGHHPGLRPSFQGLTMVDVTKLQLRDVKGKEGLGLIFGVFPFLKILSLCIDQRTKHFPQDLEIVLPDSVHDFRFHFNGTPNADDDCSLLKVIETNTKVQRVSITYTTTKYDYGKSLRRAQRIFIASRDHAEEKGLKFVVTETRGPPSFLDP